MSDVSDVESAAPDKNGGEFGPLEASGLIRQAVSTAQRQFNFWPPLLLLFGGLLFPFALGVVWWSVRNQHPYRGPTGGALAVMYLLIVI